MLPSLHQLSRANILESNRLQVPVFLAPVQPAARSGRPPSAIAFILAVVLFTGLGMLSSSVPILLLCCGACLIFVTLLLWTGDEPPILLLPILFQWSEVAILPYSTSWLHVPLAELSPYGADLHMSAIYGLLGVAGIAIGMKLASLPSKRSGSSFSERIKADAMAIPFSRVVFISFVLIGVGYLFAALTPYVGPLREPAGQASSVKYLGLFVLTYTSLIRKQGYILLISVICFEVVFGMTGFFAEFKDSILTFFVAALFAKPRIRVTDALVVSFAAMIILSVGIFWSAIKPEYRDFVNKGSGEQIVDVPLIDRVNFLSNAAGTFNDEKVADGFQRLVARHGYIEFLGLVMQNVPTGTAYQNGQITLSVFRHISVPRFLWPGKPALPSDTEVMSKYTGLPMLWGTETSISIGYLGELYADFGYWGGLLAAIVIGGVIGLAYRFVRESKKVSPLMAAGLCVIIALKVSYFGTAYVKMAGAFVLGTVIVFIMMVFVLPTLMRSQHAVSPEFSGAGLPRKPKRI
jgi:hypothetical protein